MKKRFEFFLCLIVSVFSIIYIFDYNIACAFAEEAVFTNEECDGTEKSSKFNKKIIYLTFDDGPSFKVTDKVLDVLRENDVKGTFFLIGNQIKGREDVVKRIYNEGNEIGLHTYTHKFNKIYCSEENFIKEMRECQSEISNVIGVSPNIIRFPGGSSKHLSKKYLSRLHENNFKIYDWNAENADGLNPRVSPYTLYRRAIKVADKKENIVLLLHCTDMNKNTYKALPEIIKYYKSHQYEFRTITEDTPEIYFPIRK